MTSSGKSLALFRHPETEWNLLARYQGRTDTSLSAKGLQQIQSIAALVRPHQFDIVYSSPLMRALSLARSIANRSDAPVEIDERLIEIAMGPWEGLTRTEIQQRFPSMFHDWYSRPDQVIFPEGESLRDVGRRVGDFLERLFENEEYRAIAIVSHDVVVKMAVMLALDLDFSNLHAFQASNGSLTILSGSQLSGSVKSVNSLAHLQESPLDMS